MKKKKTILITCGGGSGPIFLAKVLNKKYNIILADGSKDNAGPFFGFEFQLIPFGNSPDYSAAIKKIVGKFNVDYIVPGADEELAPICRLALQTNLFIPVIPSLDFINLCLHKKNLMEELDRASISHLLPYKSIQDVEYPAIAKPVFGRGSREVHILKDAKQLDGYLKLYNKKFEEVLVQPYIDGTEYTVSVVVNNLNKIIGIVPKKIISKKGITRAAVTERNSLINNVCKKIVKYFKPKGPFNVQLMIKNGKVCIFEINPRLSTTSVLTDRAFGNEVELFIKYYDKTSISKSSTMKAGVFLYRYEENIFK